MSTPSTVGAGPGRGFVFQKSSLHVAASASATKVRKFKINNLDWGLYSQW